MSTKIYYFRGTVMWAKVHEVDKKYGHYTLDLHLDEPSLQLFKDANTELKLREGELNGNPSVYVKFRRTPQRLIAGDIVDVGPPKVLVLNAIGEAETLTDNIGNGSTIVVKVAVYPTQKGNGHRLESVLVEKLVPYQKVEVVNDEVFAF